MATHRDPASLPRLAISLLAIVLLWPGLQLSEFNPALLLAAENRQNMGQFLAGFWPLAHDREFLTLVLHATLETLAMATVGMALAFLLGMPLALLVTRVLSRRHFSGRAASAGSFVRAPLRLLLVVLRSIPEIVWALLFVRAVGLGPTAGVLAIAITYGGMLGKVYAEIFESTDPKPARALLAAGSSRLQAFCYGVLPSAGDELVSYSVYRWECALRASVVMGIVGAGGLGQQVELSLRMFAGAEVATLLLAFILLVALADGLSRVLRKALLT